MTTLSTTDIVASSISDATLVESNYQAVKNVVNGGIDNTNVNAAAGILTTQLASGANGQVVGTLNGLGGWRNGWTKVEEQSPTSAAATFSSLPSDGTHLMFFGCTRGDHSGSGSLLGARLNGDSTNGHYFRNGWTSTSGTGWSQYSFSGSGSNISVGTNPGTSASANLFCCWRAIFQNYTSTTDNVTVLALSSDSIGAGTTGITNNHLQGVWLPSSLQAVTSVEFRCSTGNFVTGSKIICYAMKAS